MLGSGPFSDNLHGYPPPAAYPPPGGYMQPPPRNSNNTAMWAHLGMLLTWTVGWIIPPLPLFAFMVPLILRSSYRHDPFVRHHATQALNCAVTDLLVGVGAIMLIILAIFNNVGVVATILIGIAVFANAAARIVYTIIGSVKAHNGQQFRYPTWIAFRFIRDDTMFAAATVPSGPVAHD